MTYDQIFLAVTLAVFLIPFFATLVFVRQRGHDPKGIANGNTGVALLTTIATLLWLTVTLLYIFDTRSVAWFGHIAFLDNGLAQGVGMALCVGGLLVGIVGEVTLGESFRVALPRDKTGLVTRGIYRYVRNPVVLGVYLCVLGTCLIAPSFLALASVVLNFAGYHLKVRAEEAYLHQVHGAEYAAYCAQTGQYIPRITRSD